ncbi:MAG: response regulator [Gemmatimonas sp.]|nr:response regulator [Gemmatimonas sp.]
MSTAMPHAPESPQAITPEDRSTIQILVVEDEKTLLDSCSSVLHHEGYQVTGVSRGDEAREILQRRTFDIVLLDLYMTHVSGMELLRVALETKPDTIAVVMTGNPSVMSSIEALQAGAWDYLPKPFSASHLQVLIGRASHAVMVGRESDAETQPLQGGRFPERTRLRDKGKDQELTILGQSPALLKAIKLARTVARTDASVFITGESGSGKDVIARFIHQNSRRSSRPMVAVNCAALPETLLESEMFGHCKGAFTGATRDKPGLLETANGGTFFLDELTEMSMPIQAKLLRAIQDGVVRRVGSESVDAVVNVRFIAATNRDPREAVEEGHLRKDLYYRLSVVPLYVPPLRERREDVPILADHFFRQYWKRHREPGSPLPTLTNDAIRSLQSRPWHGNVRELQNVMEHAVVLLEPGSEVTVDDLPYIHDTIGADSSSARSNGGFDMRDVQDKSYHAAREHVTTEFELHYLKWLMETAGANMSRAAKMAGVDRTTLYRLMEKHGLQRDTIIKSQDD